MSCCGSRTVSDKLEAREAVVQAARCPSCATQAHLHLPSPRSLVPSSGPSRPGGLGLAARTGMNDQARRTAQRTVRLAQRSGDESGAAQASSRPPSRAGAPVSGRRPAARRDERPRGANGRTGCKGGPVLGASTAGWTTPARACSRPAIGLAGVRSAPQSGAQAAMQQLGMRAGAFHGTAHPQAGTHYCGPGGCAGDQDAPSSGSHSAPTASSVRSLLLGVRLP